MASLLPRACRLCGTPLLRYNLPLWLAPRPSRVPPPQYHRGLATIVGRPTAGPSDDLPPELLPASASTSPPPLDPFASSMPSLEASTSGAAEEATLNITEAAASQVRRIQAKEDNSKVLLRLAVESGGCHGYQYKMELTERVNPDDYTFTASESNPTPILVVDSTSLSLTSGATVDYATELIGSSFRVADNPNAKGAGCGCGVSWELKDDFVPS